MSIGDGRCLLLSKKSTAFGEPGPALGTTPTVAAALIASATSAGVADGFNWRYCATTPVTWAAAIDVPVRTPVAVLLVLNAVGISAPGAKRARQRPKFEPRVGDDTHRASERPVAPTVSAVATRPGERAHASPLLFPAATT